MVLVQCSCRPLCLIGSSIHCNCHPLKKWMISKTWVRFLAFCRLYESSFNNEFNCVQSLLTAWFPATKWVLHKVSHWLCVWVRHLACPYTFLWVLLRVCPMSIHIALSASLNLSLSASGRTVWIARKAITSARSLDVDLIMLLVTVVDLPWWRRRCLSVLTSAAPLSTTYPF